MIFFHEKDNFLWKKISFYEKDSRFTAGIIRKSAFLIGQVPI